MKKNCIVVPIYKDFFKLSNEEKISLVQLYKILSTHPIYFIGPSSLDFKEYLVHAKTMNVAVHVKEFENFYFNNIQGYNQLLLSEKFFKAFHQHEFLLIYQTDAFVFRDELNFWSSKGYDYIGAPWFLGFDKPDPTNQIIGVGNGGFSLRNVKKSILMLKRLKQLLNLNKLWKMSGLKKIFAFQRLHFLFKIFLQVKNIDALTGLEENELFEDRFWSENIPALFSDFTIAPVSEAMKFSFEVNPSLLFKLNNNLLPFGCHARERWEPKFWETHIPTSFRNSQELQ